MSKLSIIKYAEWEKAMYGHLMFVSASWIVTGKETCTKLVKEDTLSASAIMSFQLCSNNGTGEIYQWLDKGNKIHVDAIRDNPATMWNKLKEICSKSAPNACFNSLSNLFNIQLKEEEALTQPAGYTLKMLDDELSTMAMLHALPHEEYSSFISLILMLNGFTKDAILEAFRTEETQCCAAEGKGGSSMAKANTAKASNTPKVEEGCDGPTAKANTAVCRSSLSPTTPSDIQWNTDSGTMSSMTPHCEWFLPDSFKPWRVPIYVANGATVYSVEKGSVQFRPEGRDCNRE
ncbi:hypothetical protein J132_01965 [Termitomyces sp. J132]|nr:hypothetical protein J132_01965 [Termitomyces sp. J132]